MAAVSQFPPSLQVTQAEDDMEISSQAGQYDHDIEIDVDLHSEVGVEQDNDVHLDDVRSEAGSMMQTQDQDMLQDHDNAMYDEQSLKGAVDDAMASAQSPADQDLVDQGAADIASLHDVIFEDTIDQAQVDAAFHDAGNLDFDTVLEGDVIGLQAREDVTGISDAVDDVVEFSEAPDDAQQQPIDAVAVEGPTIEEQSHVDHLGDADLGHREADPAQHDTAPEDAAKLVEDLPPDEFHDTNSEHGHVHIPDETGFLEPDPEQDEGEMPVLNAEEIEKPQLHSVVVSYYDDRFSLFPPTNDDESAEFLLKDPSFASRSIAELLRACRDVLGEDVTDGEELRLVCRDLGLEIGEESAHAHSTSLSELLEVFLDLHRLDGLEYPGAFEIALEKRERFTAALSRLRAAVADGRGMSRVWEDWDDEVETHLGDGAPDDHNPPHNDINGDLDEQDDRDPVVLKAKAEAEEPRVEALTSSDVVTAVDGEDTAETKSGVSRPAELGDSENGRPYDGGITGGEDESLNQAQALKEVDDDEQEDHVDHGGPTVNEEEAHAEDDLIDYIEDELEEAESSDSSTVAGDAAADIEAVQGPTHQDESSPGSQGVTEAAHEAEEYHGVQETGDLAADSPHAGNPELAPDEFGDSGFDPEDEVEHELAPDTDQADVVDDTAWASSGRAGDTSAFAGGPEPTFEATTESRPPEDLSIAAKDEQQGERVSVIDNELFDEQDEITFDDDEDEYGPDGGLGHEEQPSNADLENESPLGKRSFEEHLQGDATEEGSDVEAKRLRST